MEDLNPIIQALGVGGGLLAAAWAIYSKLKSNAAADTASSDRSHAESSLYEKLRAEIDRAAVNEAETRVQMAGMRSDMDDLTRRCDAERLAAFEQIDKLENRIDELTIAVNACQARHLEREELDEKGRTGEIDRRATGQAPRGRRAPKVPR